MMRAIRANVMRLSMLSASATALAIATPAVAQAQVRDFDIPAQPLSSALLEFSKQSDVMVVVSPEVAEGKRAPAVRGSLRVNEAIARLLRGSGLRAVANPQGGYRIERSIASAPAGRVQSASSSLVEEGEAAQTDIVVTGTYLREAHPMSPVISIKRQDIENAGIGSASELSTLIPQNLASVSSVVNNANPFDRTNLGGATSIDLRGLGADSTLTLLNGRRLPTSSTSGSVDLNLIPLTLIERVEVLTDGASAIYGSDAVAGVVNLVTRDDFKGVELRARSGLSVDGNRSEYQLGAIAGTVWRGGGAQIGAAFNSIDPVVSTDLDYVDLPVGNPNGWLYDKEEARSAFGLFRQDITDNLDFKSTVLYSERDAETLEYTTRNTFTTVYVTSLSGNAELKYKLSNSWTISLFGDYAFNKTKYNQDAPGQTTRFTFDNELLNSEIRASGSLFSLPAGSVEIALGAARRREVFRERSAGVTRVDGERVVYAAYAESLIPLIDESMRIPMLASLDLSLAGRFEDYSDFGSVFNPRAAVNWGLGSGFSLRGTYGRSFKAPELTDIQRQLQVVFFAAPDPLLTPAEQDPRLPNGRAYALTFAAGNPDLKPEKAETITASLAYKPESIPRLSVEFSFFDVSYRNRISSVSTASAISAPELQFLVDRTPDVAYVQDFIDRRDSGDFVFLNALPAGIQPRAEDVQIIVFSGRRNLSRLHVRGVDANLSYAFDTPKAGEFSFALLASKYFNYDVAGAPTSDYINRIDYIYRPVDFKARGSVGWKSGGTSINAAVNYVDSYVEDRNPASPNKIDSWTTFDLTLGFEPRLRDGSWSGFRFLLSARNLFDKDPPRVNTGDGLNFDQTNANPLGRILSLQVSKRW